MNAGLYYSNTGLNAIQLRTDVNSNNIANVNTTAFKQERTSAVSFKEKLVEVNEQNLLQTTQGVACRDIITDFAAGQIIATGRLLDFAIRKENVFFTVQTPEGIKYLRDGSFVVDSQGDLADAKGNKILGQSGNIKAADGNLEGEFRLAEFNDREQVSRQGSFFVAGPDSKVFAAEDAQVEAGFLENSNVDLVNAMNEMLINSKNYALNSRVMMTQDSILRKAVNEVGSLK